MSSKLMLLPLGAAALAGCQSFDPVSQSPDPSFGEVSAINKLAQTINPDPVYPAGAAQPGSDAARAAAAVDRYRKGQVKQPEAMTVSGGAAGGAGNTSGGGQGGGG